MNLKSKKQHVLSKLFDITQSPKQYKKGIWKKEDGNRTDLCLSCILFSLESGCVKPPTGGAI